MRKQFLIAVAFVISTAASAQEWKQAIEKWRSCADAAAARYSKSSESAQQASPLPTSTLKRPNAIVLIVFLSTSSKCGSAEQKNADTTCDHGCALTGSVIGPSRTCPDVRVESDMRSKADIARQPY
jgi:hypothetical protein